jgi:putative DNA-invertase from lambdoid prophage Rac
MTRRDMAVYGYTRVSTDRQADDGESLGAQQRVIEGYAMMLGLTVDEIFVERGVSGSKPLRDRRQGGRLLERLKSGDIIITAKLDRMFRSALDALDVLGQIQDRGVSLHMMDLGGDVTGNGISKLVFTILSAVAEAERDRTRERIREVKQDQRRRRRYLGGKVPFGWRVEKNGELVPVPEQQRAIKRARRLRAKGFSLRRVAAALAQTGILLSHEGVKRIVAQTEAAPPKIRRQRRQREIAQNRLRRMSG